MENKRWNCHCLQMTWYYTQKILKMVLVNYYSSSMNLVNKVSGYKINIKKSLAFLHMSNKGQKQKLRKQSHLSPPQKVYLEINLPKEMKDLCTIRHWWQKSKRTQTDGKIYHVLRLEESILSKWLHYPRQSQIQCHPYQITNGIFYRTRKILNLYGDTKDPQ